MITTHQEKLDEHNDACIIWTALFDEKLNQNEAQKDNTILPFTEDFPYDSMMQANALYKNQCSI